MASKIRPMWRRGWGWPCHCDDRGGDGVVDRHTGKEEGPIEEAQVRRMDQARGGLWAKPRAGQGRGKRCDVGGGGGAASRRTDKAVGAAGVGASETEEEAARAMTMGSFRQASTDGNRLLGFSWLFLTQQRKRRGLVTTEAAGARSAAEREDERVERWRGRREAREEAKTREGKEGVPFYRLRRGAGHGRGGASTENGGRRPWKVVGKGTAVPAAVAVAASASTGTNGPHLMAEFIGNAVPNGTQSFINVGHSAALASVGGKVACFWQEQFSTVHMLSRSYEGEPIVRLGGNGGYEFRYSTSLAGSGHMSGLGAQGGTPFLKSGIAGSEKWQGAAQ
uniref:Uncharacterized protein n=1 Tax=Oryza sativa subsp. japonica TaxID=39947 RepID=Q6EQX7_ORYSJ|nr:hypothetical protein [Oryza sativa Japonica Group]BAD28943.1 hypothetical protein [Oryza sativa Japonica Group]